MSKSVEEEEEESSSSSSLSRVQGYLKDDVCYNKLYIGGKFVDPLDNDSSSSGDDKKDDGDDSKKGEEDKNTTYPTTYPATGEHLHSFPRGKTSDVQAAVAAAAEAWEEGAWSSATAEYRASVVSRMADAVESNAEILAEIEAADVGKPVRQSSAVLGGCVGEARYWCSLGRVMDADQDVPASDGGGSGGLPPPSFDAVYRRDPVGVTGLISSWNYPLNVAFRKVAPSLVAGNCVVLKPSEIAPLSCMYLSRAAEIAGVPPGAFNVVTGDGSAGAALSSHPDVQMISFTGSTTTGSKIMNASSSKLSQCMLELGGKSAMVVFDDADLDKAVETTMKGFLTNGGQICTAHTRLLLQDTAGGGGGEFKTKFLAKLKGHVEALPYSSDPITERERGDRTWESGMTDVVQPVVCESQRIKILDALRRAEECEDIEVLCGGGIPPESQANKSGYYVQPTVLLDVPLDHELWNTEVFGPVLSVRTFATESDAVAQVNSTPFGLASTVFTSSPGIARRVSAKIRAGTVYVTSTGDGLLAEFPCVRRGGYGRSGIGRELGLDGLYEYTELKSVIYTGGFSLKEATKKEKEEDDIKGTAAKRQRTE